MAAAKPANRPVEDETKQEQKPVIEYFGVGADKVKFEIDQNASRIRVFADGRILIDY